MRIMLCTDEIMEIGVEIFSIFVVLSEREDYTEYIWWDNNIIYLVLPRKGSEDLKSCFILSFVSLSEYDFWRSRFIKNIIISLR